MIYGIRPQAVIMCRANAVEIIKHNTIEFWVNWWDPQSFIDGKIFISYPNFRYFSWPVFQNPQTGFPLITLYILSIYFVISPPPPFLNSHIITGLNITFAYFNSILLLNDKKWLIFESIQQLHFFYQKNFLTLWWVWHFSALVNQNISMKKKEKEKTKKKHFPAWVIIDVWFIHVLLYESPIEGVTTCNLYLLLCCERWNCISPIC